MRHGQQLQRAFCLLLLSVFSALASTPVAAQDINGPAELLGVIGPDAELQVRPYGWWDAVPLLPIGQPTSMALRVIFYIKRTPHNERWGIEVASGPLASTPGAACPRIEPGSSFEELAADVTVTAVDVDFDGTVDGWTVWTGGGEEPASVPVLICKVEKKADEVVDVGTATLRFEVTALLIEKAGKLNPLDGWAFLHINGGTCYPAAPSQRRRFRERWWVRFSEVRNV